MTSLVVDISIIEDLYKVAQILAKFIDKTPFVCLFDGELGLGKTTLLRAYLAALGYSGKVKSPTFTLVESYDLGHMVINHFDLYRLNDPEELYFIGIEEYLTDGINFIEWPSRAGELLPPADLSCKLWFEGDKRLMSFQMPDTSNLATLEKLLKNAGLCLQ